MHSESNTVVTHSNSGAVVSVLPMTDEQVSYAAGLSYWTVVVPWSDRPTAWHPTERKGLWSVLTRGAFKTFAEAQAWADANLQGQPCSFRWTAFELTAQEIRDTSRAYGVGK